jgi:hypothetical protein
MPHRGKQKRSLRGPEGTTRTKQNNPCLVYSMSFIRLTILSHLLIIFLVDPSRHDHGHGPRMINVDLDDDQESLDLILSASINLVAISAEPSELQASAESYSGVYGDFCALNFAVHKADPSAGTYSIASFCILLYKLPTCLTVLTLYNYTAVLTLTFPMSSPNVS